MSPHTLSPPPRRPQRGMTLVEVMVGLALGLIVVGAILSTYLMVARSQITQLGESQLSQNGESSTGFIRRMVREAGLVDPTSDLNGLNNFMSEQPAKPSQDLFGTRNPDPANAAKALNSVDMLLTGTTTVLTTRRELVPASATDLDCLGRPAPAGTASRVVASCTITFDLGDGSIIVQAQTTGQAASPKVPLVTRGLLQDVQFRAAQQPASTLYNARSAAQPGIFYGDASGVADWSQVVGLEMCLVIGTPTDPQARASSYTRCDGTVTPVPATGASLSYRTLRSVMQLRNRSAVMPFLTPEAS